MALTQKIETEDYFISVLNPFCQLHNHSRYSSDNLWDEPFHPAWYAPRSTLLKTNTKNIERKTTIDFEKRTVEIQTIYKDNRYSVPLQTIFFLELYAFLKDRNEGTRRILQKQLLISNLSQQSAEKKGGFLEYEIPVKFPKMVERIIGSGGPKLRINGSQTIDFSGEQSWTNKDELNDPTATSKIKIPNLTLKQDHNFTIRGSIGKIELKVDQDTKSFNDLIDNDIKIHYGSTPDDEDIEDEIIQEVDAGNTQLEMRGSEFAGYTEQHKGLFGIKVKSKLGKIAFTTLASQEKGEGVKGKKTAGSGSASSKKQGDEFDYKPLTYFFLDTTYYNHFPDKISGAKVTRLKLYVNNQNFNQDWYKTWQTKGALIADAYKEDKIQENGLYYIELLQDKHFELFPEYGFFRLKSLNYQELGIGNISENDIIAVWYETENLQTYPASTLTPQDGKLKIIKPRTQRPEDMVTWNLEWRNVYGFDAFSNTDPDQFQSFINSFDLKLIRGTNSTDEIQYEDPASPEATNYLNIFGLSLRDLRTKIDREKRYFYRHTADGQKDQQFPDLDLEIFDFDRGEIILPNKRPFENLLKKPVPIIYNKLRSDLQSGLNQTPPEFSFMISSKVRSNQIDLGILNVYDVTVKVGGEKLQEGVDYEVISEVGQVILTSERARDPNREVEIDYEYAPFFNPDQKILLGQRVDHDFNENAKIGGMVLFKKEFSSETSPQLGREENWTLLSDINGELKYQPAWMTQAVNAIPFVQTQSPSNFTMTGEVANVLYNTNTKGKAFVDNFEASNQTDPMTLTYSTWFPSSSLDTAGFIYPEKTEFLTKFLPVDSIEIDTLVSVSPPKISIDTSVWINNEKILLSKIDSIVYSAGFIDSVLFRDTLYIYRLSGLLDTLDVPILQGPLGENNLVPGHTYWYNPSLEQRVNINEIWPKKQVIGRDRSIDILVLAFEPYNNYTPFYKKVPSPIVTQDKGRNSWGGILKYLNAAYYDQRKTKYLDLWLNFSNSPTDAVLNIDIGRINEEVIPNGRLDTEAVREGSEYYTSRVTQEQDVGLDGLNNTQEKKLVDSLGLSANGILVPWGTRDDPQGDDRKYDSRNSPTFYRYLNGTEDNAKDQLDRPSSEDINNSGALDKINNYFEYRMSLNQKNNPFLIPGTENNGWALYRIPLQDTSAISKIVGTPGWDEILFMRLWLTNAAVNCSLKVAKIEFVRNQWEPSPIIPSDKHLTAPEQAELIVSVVNTHENDTAEYTPPPDVFVERDPTTRIILKEQSLQFNIKKLKPGQQATAYRYFTSYQKLDFSLYKAISLRVYGEKEIQNQLTTDMDHIRFSFRFGRDSSNYYEYFLDTLFGGNQASDLSFRPDYWRQGWLGNAIHINFAELTEIKGAYYQARGNDFTKGIDTVDATRHFRYHGKPSISDIQWISLGIVNTDSLGGGILNGRILFDELILEDTHRKPGWRGKTALNLQFADFFRLSTSLDYSNFAFHNMQEAKTFRENFGSKSTSLSGQFASSLQFNKFLPETWGIRIPLDFNLSATRSRPRLVPGSDILLNEEDGFLDLMQDILGSTKRQRYERIQRGWSLSTRYDKNRFTQTTFFRSNWLNSATNLFPNLTWDRIRLDFYHKRDFGEDYSRNDTTYFYRGGLNYDLSPQKPIALSLFSWTKGKYIPNVIQDYLSDIKWSLLPSKLNFSTDLSYNKKKTFNNINQVREPLALEIKADHLINLGYSPLTSLTLDYNLKMNRDFSRQFNEIVNFDISHTFLSAERNSTLLLNNQKPFVLLNETSRNQTFHLAYNPRLFKWLDNNLSYTSNYDHALGRNSVVFRRINGFIVDLTRSSNINFNPAINLSTLFESLEKLFDFSKSASLPFSTIKKTISNSYFSMDRFSATYVYNEKYNLKSIEGMGRFFDSYSELISYQLGFPSADYAKDLLRSFFNFNRYPANADDLFGKTKYDSLGSSNQDIRDIKKNYGLRSGVNFAKSFSFTNNTNYTLEVREYAKYNLDTVTHVYNDTTKKLELINGKISWSGLMKIPGLNKYVRSGQPNCNLIYSRESKTQQKQLNRGTLFSATPGLSLTWKKNISSNHNWKWEWKNDTTFLPGSELGITKDRKWSLENSISHTISAAKGIGIPYWKGKDLTIKFQNNLQLRGLVNYSRTKSIKQVLQNGQDKNLPSYPGLHNLEVIPSALYTFTQKVNGEFYIKYTRSSEYDDKNDDKPTLVKNSLGMGLKVTIAL